MTQSTPSFDLAQKTAVVIGAAGPLGRQLALALAQAGADTLLVGRRKEPLVEAARVIQDTGGNANAFPADLSTESGALATAAEAAKRFGHLDILVNAAAQSSGRPIEEITLDQWRATIAASLDTAFLAAKHLGILMKPDGGSIVLVGSIYGVVSPDPRIYPQGMASSSPDYAAAKSALIGLTRHIAVHWAQHNIRCNLLSPGGVASDGNDIPAFRQAYENRTPAQRMAHPDDIVGALLFLASDASQYVTGHNLIVDGGWTAW